MSQSEQIKQLQKRINILESIINQIVCSVDEQVINETVSIPIHILSEISYYESIRDETLNIK